VSLVPPGRRMVTGDAEDRSLKLGSHPEVGEESAVDIFDPLPLQIIQSIMARLVGPFEMDVNEIVLPSQPQDEFRSPPIILERGTWRNLSHLHS